jgi:hypothetical protein
MRCSSYLRLRILDEFVALLEQQLNTIDILGGNLTMESREIMAKQLVSVVFDTDREIEMEAIQDELEML